MDNHTIVVSIIVNTILYGALMLSISLRRKSKLILIVAANFFYGGLNYILPLGQGQWSPWLSYVLYNFNVILFLVLFFACIRQYLELPFWRWRFTFYLIVSLIVFILFGVIYPSFLSRVLANAILSCVLIADLILSSWRKLKIAPNPSKSIFLGAMALTFSLNVVRAIISVLSSNHNGTLLDQSLTTTATLMFALVSYGVWGAVVMLADSGAMVALLNEKNKELAQLAVTDTLTGLFNRNLFEQELENLTQTADRNDEPLSLLILDLDLFKNVNDEYGHSVGDEVLKETANVIRKSIRSSDRAYRWGGEEFIVIAPGTNIAGAVRLAERIRQAYEGNLFPVINHMTISIGAAEHFADESKDLWFKRADLSLYKAKQTRRNRVIAWNDTAPLSLSHMKFDWQVAWESGHPEIDKQHKEMLSLSNQLIDMELAGQTHEALDTQLGLLQEHFLRHFQYEEALMDSIGYAKADKHRLIHAGLYADLGKMRKDLRTKNIDTKTLFTLLVGKIEIGHMLQEDADFFPLVGLPRQ